MPGDIDVAVRRLLTPSPVPYEKAGASTSLNVMCKRSARPDGESDSLDVILRHARGIYEAFGCHSLEVFMI